MTGLLQDPELSAAIGLEDAEIAALIEPFVIERHPLASAQWRSVVAERARLWRRKLVGKRLVRWLKLGRRTQSFVNESYSNTWTNREWPILHAGPKPRDAYPLKQQLPAEWKDEGLVLRRVGSLQRLHLAQLERVIEVLKPASVLEVGAGDGINLLTLSGRFPSTRFTGVELTAAGVARAKATQREASLPRDLEQYMPWPPRDASAYQRIEFGQGDATRLPFDADSFDLVLTRQALEQMELVREAALREIARVSRRDVVLYEPFSEFNADRLRRRYVRAKQIFSMPAADLPRFGIEPRWLGAPGPLNIELVAALCVARVAR